MAHKGKQYPDYYRILNVDCDSSANVIKQKYHQLSLQLHPDKQASDGHILEKGIGSKFVELNEAYRVLSDPLLKQEYDFQYVAHVNQSSFAVHDRLSLDELEENSDEGGYELPCRCGGIYRLFEEAVRLTLPTLYVSCDTCSLCIAVDMPS